MNTFLNSKGSPTIVPEEVIRATEDEKKYQISMLDNLHQNKLKQASESLQLIQNAAINQENIFEVLMEACKHCSIGQITTALFEVGGQHRRNM